MDRVEAIRKDFAKESLCRFQESSQSLMEKYHESEGVIRGQIIELFTTLFYEAARKQGAGEKGDIYYICVFTLKSSVITRSCKYQVSLYEDILYLDQSEISKNYIPEFIIPYFERDMEYLEQSIKKKFFRLKPYEMEPVAMMHMAHYHEFIQNMITENLKHVLVTDEYQTMQRSENLLFLFGGYRDLLTVMAP